MMMINGFKLIEAYKKIEIKNGKQPSSIYSTFIKII